MMKRFTRRLRALFKRSEVEAELDEELRFHLAKEIEQNVGRGMSPEEARRAALVDFGGVEGVKEDCREVRGVRPLRDLWQDLRYAVRVLLKRPGFTLVAVATLALGVGANTAVFSVVNAALLKPLPYHEPDRLVRLSEYSEKVPTMSVSYPNFLDWREQQTSFELMAAMQPGSYNLSGEGEPERLAGSNVSPEFFKVLGVEPALGRSFTEEENRPGVSRVAVISHGMWQRRFGSDPHILGRALTLNGEPYTVVGVTRQGFVFGGPIDVYVPLGSLADRQMLMRDNHPGIYVLARLKPGVTAEGALREMQTIAARLGEQYPDTAGNSVALRPLSEFFVGDVRPALLVLLGAVGLVLLIACANVANLLLARAAARGREMAIRTALGASRLRVMRQLLVESVLLSLAGGAAGLLLAVWSVGFLRTAAADNLPPTAAVGLDANVLLFTLLISILTGLVFGLAPAVQASRADLNSALKEGARSQTGGRSRQHVRSALVVAEVALSLLLLVGAGLLLKSFAHLRETPLGFEPAGLLTMQVSRSVGKGQPPAGAVAYFDQMRERVGALPGVKAVAYAEGLPQLGAAETLAAVEGRPQTADGPPPLAVRYTTSPGYLEAMGIRLVRGRFFDERDTLKSQRVAVVDEEFARALFPGEDPVGQRLAGFAPEGIPPAEIVGLVEHVNHYGVSGTEPVKPQVYFALKQIPERIVGDVVGRGLFVTARTEGDPASLAPALRRESNAIDPAQPVYRVRTMEEVMAGSIATQRLSATLLAFFAAVALVLAAVGIYGVMSYMVTQRTHEIGIRMALGAQRRDVLRLVVRQGMLLTLLGLGLGLAGALALTRLMASLLYGVSATDPLIFAVVPVVLAAVALLANLVPARRAMRLDPLVALRHE